MGTVQVRTRSCGAEVSIPQGHHAAVSWQQQAFKRGSFTQPIQCSRCWHCCRQLNVLVFEDEPVRRSAVRDTGWQREHGEPPAVESFPAACTTRAAARPARQKCCPVPRSAAPFPFPSCLWPRESKMGTLLPRRRTVSAKGAPDCAGTSTAYSRSCALRPGCAPGLQPATRAECRLRAACAHHAQPQHTKARHWDSSLRPAGWLPSLSGRRRRAPWHD